MSKDVNSKLLNDLLETQREIYECDSDTYDLELQADKLYLKIVRIMKRGENLRECRRSESSKSRLIKSLQDQLAKKDKQIAELEKENSRIIDAHCKDIVRIGELEEIINKVKINNAFIFNESSGELSYGNYMDFIAVKDKSEENDNLLEQALEEK
jgi:hypothetical protein